MTLILDAFTQEELEEILEDLKEEFRTGVISSYSSLGESAQFSRIPLLTRMEMVIETLKKKDPATYGKRVKTGRQNFNNLV